LDELYSSDSLRGNFFQCHVFAIKTTLIDYMRVRIISQDNFIIIMLLKILFITRPSVASVPVYDDDSARDKRKVQRVTSPEKWEIKQVGQLFYYSVR
jgi:hypothetical protein